MTEPIMPDFSRSRSSLISRADLLWAMVEKNQKAVDVLAAQLRLKVRLPVLEPPIEPRTPLPNWIVEPAPSLVVQDSSGYPNNIPGTAFWLPVRFRKRGAEAETGSDNAKEFLPRYWNWRSAPKQIPQQTPLSPWPVIWDRLRPALSVVRVSRQIDLVLLADRFARLKPIRQLPRLKKRNWNGRCTIILDESLHLAPYFADQQYVVDHLSRLLNAETVSVFSGQTPSILYRRTGQPGDLQFAKEQPPVGSRILVLGDLGCLSQSPTAWQEWFRWGQERVIAGCELLALFPGSIARVPRPLRQLYKIHSWQMDRTAEIPDRDQREKQIRRVLTLAAPALRLEPGLLRDLRMLLPDLTDVSLEADIWNSRLLSSRHFAAATINRQLVRDSLRPAFEALSESQRDRVLECIKRWRKLLEESPEVWFEEILNLSAGSRKLIDPLDREDAYACWRDFDQKLSEGDESCDGLQEFVERFTRRAGDEAIDDAEVGPVIQKYRMRFHPDLGIHPATDPENLPASDEPRAFHVRVNDTKAIVSTQQDADLRIPSAVTLHGTNNYIQIGQDDARFWKHGKPSFVSDFGTDEYGAWFEFQVPGKLRSGVVTQRMRWIPPGSFQMGSPSSEVGRESIETQHEVVLTRGFWMADTACTQEMWAAIMGTTIHRSRQNQHPAENMSHYEVIGFLTRLSERIPGLAPALPTEAQWEYAGRAGSTTPYWFGPTITTDQANFNGHYLVEGSGASDFRRVTLDVKTFNPNRWGLYQVHGNVWEWCSDWYASYQQGLQIDPTGPMQGTHRVIRGGSWFNDPRDVRSASRRWDEPEFSDERLGFRFCSHTLAEPTDHASVPVQRDRPSINRSQNFQGRTIELAAGATEGLQHQSTSSICIRSNVQEVVLQRTPKPSWAVAWGVDVYGQYADFEVPRRNGDGKVRQRMRWIPPGHFLMGSPKDEPGRNDNELQHQVTMDTGFWMFDTPVTQDLYKAVIGDNPSYFPDPLRPVEQVDLEMAEAFAVALSKCVPGLIFHLPTEAQWEYACRAGTTSAIYSGPMEMSGAQEATALDLVAWYRGNCWNMFDLEKGYDCEDWKEKQFLINKAGSRRVKCKAPNQWGLYDMLGNVWEWCSGWYQYYYDIDPDPWDHIRLPQRGGSWYNLASDVRSASRSQCRQGSRDFQSGFRLMSFAEPEPLRHCEEEQTYPTLSTSEKPVGLPMAGRRVLVIDGDGDAVTRVFTQRLLEKIGCEVDIVQESSEACVMVRSQNYDAVLIDVQINDRSGYECFRQLREITADLKIIMMVDFGYDAEYNVERARMEGLSSVVFKPYLGDHGVTEVENVVLGVAAVRRRDPFATSTFSEASSRPKPPYSETLIGKRVLVVDDDASAREEAHYLLGQQGCQVEAVQNSADACAMVREYHYDVVLLNNRLRDATGYECFQRIRRISPHMPVIMMTGFGYDASHTILRARSEGVGAVVYKPFRRAQLLAEVEKAVKTPSS